MNDPLAHPISLMPPDHKPKVQAPEAKSGTPGVALTTMVGGLAVCLGVFLLFVWATRRNSTTSTRPLPSEVIESLGRMALAPRQQLQLVRLGKKLVLLSVSPHGVETLTEVDDAEEVTRLTGLCHQDKSNSVSATFREVLNQYGREPAAPGFLGQGRSESDNTRTGHSRRPTRREDVHA